jgi:hypothetical protein
MYLNMYILSHDLSELLLISGTLSNCTYGCGVGDLAGGYLNQDFPWLRWWDDAGNLLLAGDELAKRELLRAEQESLRAERAVEQVAEEKQRTEQERQRADRLAAKLRELGIDAEDA